MWDTGSSGRSGKGGASGCPVRQGSGNGFLDVCAGNGRACIRTCSFSVSERTWGKAIAVSFGVLIGLLPLWQPLAALIFWYLLFVIVISARSNTRKSVYTFLAFAVTVMLTVPRRTVLAGCVLMSGIVIHKHCLKANAAYRRGEEWRLE